MRRHAVNTADNSFTQYYLRELAQLEDDCIDFSQAHPAISAHMGMGAEGATDPHVRQLIEGVAFIAARVRQQLDTIPGELAYGMVNSFAPHLTRPVPSMSIARFAPLSAQLEPMGVKPPKEFRLSAGGHGQESVFTIPDPEFELWPLQLECFWTGDSATEPRRAVPGFADVNGFAMRIEHPSKKIGEGAPGELTFFLSGGLSRALAALDGLMFGLSSLTMVALDGGWRVDLPLSSLQLRGFKPRDRLLPSGSGADAGGAAALEFLTFPRRFCFFTVSGLRCPKPSRAFFLVLTVKSEWMGALQGVRHNILLNCAPVVNLYPRSPVAVSLKEPLDEYPIARGDTTKGLWDVHSIQAVKLLSTTTELPLREFHLGVEAQSTAALPHFWQGARKERVHNQVAHASLWLRLASTRGPSSCFSEFDIAMLDLLCTNCEAPESLANGQLMDQRGWDSGYQATMEFAPTAYIPPLLPSDPMLMEILQALQWRSLSSDSVVGMLRRFLQAHHRGLTAHSAAVLASIESIHRKIVAMPWPGLAVGALTMGCQYFVRFNEGEQTTSSRYIVGRLVKTILSQKHDLPMPMEVHIEGARGTFILAD